MKSNKRGIDLKGNGSDISAAAATAAVLLGSVLKEVKHMKQTKERWNRREERAL